MLQTVCEVNWHSTTTRVYNVSILCK